VKGGRNVQVQYRPLAELKAYERNARKHPEAQIQALAAAIKEFGFTNPVLVTPEGEIIAGHGRVAAARALGLSEVPTIALSGLSEAQRRALVLADNRIAEGAAWDNDLLALELADIRSAGFDLGVIGFSDAELVGLLNGGLKKGLTDPDAAPPPPEVPVARAGDVWICGSHRIRCGDATKKADVESLMAGSPPLLMVTDPPYGV
jgi:ParB-like chromosome segregation protein Spo0J